MRKRESRLVRKAKKANPERYQRVRAACCNQRRKGFSLDEPAARIVLHIEARAGRHPLPEMTTRADKEEV